MSTYKRPPEAERVILASKLGDIKTVRSYMVEYTERTQSENLDLIAFVPALDEALANDHADVFSCLLEHGVPMDRAPILEVVDKAVETKSTKFLKICLDYGWDINQPLSRSRPPALACVLGDETITRWFLDHGADPNARCELDITPLSWAVQYAPLSTIKILLQYGGDVGKGQVLHHAVLRESSDQIIDILGFLLQLGAPINEVKYEKDPISYRQRSPFGLGTPLHKAAELGLLEVVVFLLENGADVSIKETKQGKTALEEAETYGEDAVVELLRDWEGRT